MASSSPQFSHLHDPTLKASTDSALTQASELISSSLSMPPMSITQSSLPGLPSSSPTQSHVLPRATTPSSLPAQDPSLISPPSVDTRPRGDSAEVSRALTDWHAARESVVNQMVTSQDIVTPATVPRTAAKTRARRGRGSRRASTKSRGQLHSGIEGSVFTPVEATGSPSGRGRSRGTGRGRGRGRGRGGGRPRGSASGLKRKRAESEDEIRVVKHESDSSETFTQLPTQSRSGRRIFQASAFTPVVLDLEAGAEFNPLPINGIAAPVEKGKRGKMGLRKAGDASVCKNCGRGHSPASNMIVFCDGCNTPWHQHCHDRPISKDVVLIEEKEWFCADCDVLQEERLQLKETVSAEGMSLDEKRRYLQTLPASHLVSLLLHATRLYPTLPIISTTTTSIPSSGTNLATHVQSQAQAQTNSHPQPQLSLPSPIPIPILGSSAAQPLVTEEEETYDLYPSSGALPYPKAGNGVTLPREKDDLAFLIDDDAITFSHVWDWDGGKLLFGENVRKTGIGLGLDPVDRSIGVGA